MIFGVGVDIEEVSRFERLAGHPRAGRVYGARELAMLRARGSLASWAANFCAKEAFAKSLGTGMRGFSLFEAEVLRDGAGRPYLLLSGNALRAARGLRFHVSLSHTAAAACAVVGAETAGDGPSA